MPENPRIEELRRRVQADPASIAFAALAEEYRRLGRYDEAIDTCLAGLQRHPAYLSARVTLGRALIETGELESAREQFETVLRSAPENIAATRGLGQILERLDHSTQMDPHLAQLMREHAEAAPPPEPVPLLTAPPPAEPAPAPEELFDLVLPEPAAPESLLPMELAEPLSEPLQDLPLEPVAEVPFIAAEPVSEVPVVSEVPIVVGPEVSEVPEVPIVTAPEVSEAPEAPMVLVSQAPEVPEVTEVEQVEQVEEVEQVEVEAIAGVPAPVVVAAIARLERFLAAIDVARRA